MAEEDGRAHLPLQAAGVDPASAHISPAAGAARQCALCSGSITGRNVVCEGCGSLYHAETVCLGVDDALIATLLDGEGCIAYKCCRCRGGATRTEGAQGNDFGMVNEILFVVGSWYLKLRSWHKLQLTYRSQHTRPNCVMHLQ